MTKFFITSAIPYVNAVPHIGHALEFVQTDVIARYHRLIGNEVLVLCGGDENALKNVQAAEKAHTPIQQFVDQNNLLFMDLAKKLDCKYDVWQKGSNQQLHFPSSQELWQRCQKDIYQKTYKGLYCVGCEAFYTPEELNDKGECFEHPGKKLEEIEEKNYFFKLSSYESQIKELVSSGKLRIVPEKRKNEVLAFLEKGLEDISISRSNERAKNWGVPVPNDPTQRMYVWFDALNIYQSGIGFGWDEKKYNKWWPADIHVIGKGIIRFHAIYWPAFLLSAGLKLPQTLFVHEYFTVNGQKMSKTLGNVIDPLSLIEKYNPLTNDNAVDALRYYFLAQFSPFSDGDFSEDQFKKTYNADLANGLGNLVARVAKLCEKNKASLSPERKPNLENSLLLGGYKEHLEQFEFNLALEEIWKEIKTLDITINKDKPWELNQTEVYDSLQGYTRGLINIAFALQSFLPNTAKKIIAQFSEGKISAQPPLFPRLV